MARKKKKKKPPPQNPGPMRWTFARGIPTHDFFQQGPLTDPGNLEEAVENFVYKLEQDSFLTWEAVICDEQGLPLTAEQEDALDALLNFGDPDDDQILYINDMPRPSEPWYAILNKIVPHLLVEPFRTDKRCYQVMLEGWPRIMAALDEHGQHLSLPPDSASHREVVPADLRHKLWLQYVFDTLHGLGQDDPPLLLDEEDPWRVDELIRRMRECRDSVAHAGLTLDSLLARVDLPPRDRPVLIRLMRDKLGLSSAQEPIADHLQPLGPGEDTSATD